MIGVPHLDGSTLYAARAVTPPRIIFTAFRLELLFSVIVLYWFEVGFIFRAKIDDTRKECKKLKQKKRKRGQIYF